MTPPQCPRQQRFSEVHAKEIRSAVEVGIRTGRLGAELIPNFVTIFNAVRINPGQLLHFPTCHANEIRFAEIQQLSGHSKKLRRKRDLSNYPKKSSGHGVFGEMKKPIVRKRMLLPLLTTREARRCTQVIC